MWQRGSTEKQVIYSLLTALLFSYSFTYTLVVFSPYTIHFSLSKAWTDQSTNQLRALQYMTVQKKCYTNKVYLIVPRSLFIFSKHIKITNVASNCIFYERDVWRGLKVLVKPTYIVELKFRPNEFNKDYIREICSEK